VHARRLKQLAAFIVVAVTVASPQTKSKRYNLQGEVISKNPTTDQITVKHGDISGFMPAMTMPFKVKDPAVLRQLQPGDKIAAELVVPDNGNAWLDSIRILDRSGRRASKPASPTHPLVVGEAAPDLPMTNQDGKTIRLSDFKGKGVLVTFIYTRCPMPTFCPRLSSQFAKIQSDLKKTPDDYRRTHLLTISFDPKYDTPAVLRKYGLAYLDDDASGFAHWDFAVPTSGDLRKLANAFGLEYVEEDNQITHSMDIVLISPNGKVAKYWETEWTTPELEKALTEQAARVAAVSRSEAGPKGR